MPKEKKEIEELENPEEEQKLDIEDIKDPSEEGEEIDLEEAVSEEEEKEESLKESKLKKEINSEEEESSTAVIDKTEEVKPLKTKKSKKPFPTNAVITVVVTMMITAAVVLGGVYYCLNNFNFNKKEEPKVEETKEVKQKEEEPKTQESIVFVAEPTGLNLREEPNPSAKLIVLMPFGSKLRVLGEENGWLNVEFYGKTGWCSKQYTAKKDPLVYKNTKFGFEITFPSSWSGYKVFEGGPSEVALYYFGLPTTDKNWVDTNADSGYATLFAVTIYSKSQYEDIKKEGGSIGSPIATKGDYVYVANQAQARPNDLASRYEEVQSIFKSFKTI